MIAVLPNASMPAAGVGLQILSSAYQDRMPKVSPEADWPTATFPTRPIVEKRRLLSLVPNDYYLSNAHPEASDFGDSSALSAKLQEMNGARTKQSGKTYWRSLNGLIESPHHRISQLINSASHITYPASAVPTLIPFGFIVSEQENISHFLRRFPEASNVLRDALPHVRRIFGDAPIDLRIIEDPDSDGSEDMFAYIQVSQSEGSALEKLDRFDEAWWFARSAIIAAPIHFDLEYV